MVDNARKLGYKYICISDHSQSEKIAHGMSIDRIKRQIREIKQIDKKVILWDTGSCPTHWEIDPATVLKIKNEHPIYFQISKQF